MLRGTEASLVKDQFHAASRLAHGLQVDQVALDQLDAMANRFQVDQAARAEVVEHPHGMP